MCAVGDAGELVIGPTPQDIGYGPCRALRAALVGAMRLRLFVVLLLSCAPAAAQEPPQLPRYDLDIHLDVLRQCVRVRQRVTWTNPSSRPAEEVVFNVFPHFKLPDADVGMTAKMFEILRVMPGETLDLEGRAGAVRKVELVKPAGEVRAVRGAQPDELPAPREVATHAQELRYHYRKDNDTALVVPLPSPVGPGQAVVLDIDYFLRLPQRQGRWGQWLHVTSLANWLPVLAYYDQEG